MSQTSEKSPTTANSNLDPLEHQPNAQQESMCIPPFPRQVSLTDLKVQFAFIQCISSWQLLGIYIALYDNQGVLSKCDSSSSSVYSQLLCLYTAYLPFM
ncbi:hypothetical protein HMPREF1544_01130 [Mucor circinelloides 1006PhL]|uniref:Uncharacterized protein n=1 Tax=Mucor circinelloides f. circinelloides (strain 1006PhL) TaxID=1220926 RepID=S2JNZ7_MUCC1|nr:hypothetical protein HMPREF1544_01130 [Mucor circinelloides 1006PhL]